MKRLVMMGLGVFLLAFGGTTGALVAKARRAHPGASAEVRPDSTKGHADSAVVSPDSGAARAIVAADSAPATPGTPATPSDSAAHTATPVSAALGAAPAAPAAPVPSRSNAADERAAAAYKQLARIFANMKTTDAAKVLAYMSDGEVQGVLQQLGVRPAAGLLAALPKERAAALSRRLLGSAGGKASAP